MRRFHRVILPGLLATAALHPLASQAAIDLKSAGDFGLLGATTITSTGPTVINNGDLGLKPGSSITGFPPAVVNGATHIGDTVAQQAQNDLATAYTAALSLTPTRNLSGLNLGGLTLLPGVYSFSSTAALDGRLVLDGRGDPNAQFVFQVGTTLTTGSFSQVAVVNQGAMPGSQVFWQVGSSATLGSGSQFAGNILANTSITMETAASIMYGSALAKNGSITLDSNTIYKGAAPVSPVPEPGTLSLMLSGSLLVMLRRFRRPVRRADRIETASIPQAPSAFGVRLHEIHESPQRRR
ncbi:DUF3494 domain-containing protein [Xylophilus sp. Kf1]|nr:DUF3494 domain-containing protein [Xylophilus sp. Kf1]